jgi:RNA polymerase sigma-70 factor (ECF subfamily)
VKTSTLIFPALDNGADTLVDRVRRGERAALAEAFDAHHQAVRGLARRLVGNDGFAEDLVQEVFLALPRALSGFEGRSSLRTFLLSMVLNHAKHHVRSAARRRAMATRFSAEPREIALDGVSEASRAEIARLLERAMDELTLEQRTAFVLLELEERTSVEAAEIVGVPEATMRTRLFHAKKKLRELLAQWGMS